MANLNVSQPKGKNDLDKLKSLLSSAATGTEEMKEVFAVPSSQPKAKKQGRRSRISHGKSFCYTNAKCDEIY